MTATPSVVWAQRPKIVFVTINVSDVKEPEIKVRRKKRKLHVILKNPLHFQVEKNSLYFKGTAAADKKVYELNMKLLKEIDPEKTKYQVRDRCIEFALEKVEEGPYWERLLEEKTKQHWLKVDFGKWKDEDDSDEEAGGGDLEDMMANMGGLGGGMGGMPGMGGMGGMPGMGGMGGMPGMGGMGGMPPGKILFISLRI